MKSSDPTLRRRNINGLVYINGIKHAHDKKDKQNEYLKNLCLKLALIETSPSKAGGELQPK